MATDDKHRVLALLKQHGWNATSFQVLEDGFNYWFDESGDACVAYAEAGGAWVVAGAPIACDDQLREVSERFSEAARCARRRVCFFAVEQRFLAADQKSLLIGEQPVWDPTLWSTCVASSRTLREQLRRARAKGVTVRALSAADLAEGADRRSVEALIARWLASRPLAPMGFLVDVQPFSFAAERRYFVAEQQGRIVAFLAAVPVYARSGWFFEDILRVPDAPNGSVEALIDAAMTDLATQQCHYVTLGLAPLSGGVARWLHWARLSSAALYDFDGVKLFKAKLRPQTWEPIYLAYSRQTTAVVALWDTLSAFARGNLVRFGLHTVLRGPGFVVQALALLLVPWTVALSWVDPQQWFPSTTIRDFWIAFDCCLTIGLLSLSLRWRDRWARALALAVTLDSALTLGQIAAFNWRHVRGPIDVLLVAVGWLAPTFAAVVLWKARSLRRELVGLNRRH